MSGDYLWDGSGEPDPEVERLEEALAPLRRIPPPPNRERSHSRRLRLPWRPFAAAAAVVLALAGVAAVAARRGAPAAGWSVDWLQGATWSEARVFRADRLAVGQWIDTGGDRVRLAVGTIGQVRLEPSTRVRLVDAGRRAHRLSLAHGTLHAMIWAPPGQFLVDTPAAMAVDLGCEYTLEVQEDGSGILRVQTGWVGFEHDGRQSLVPAGAVCRTRPGRGPGTPRFETASPAFAAALDAVDAGEGDGPRGEALERVLAEARPRDALSVWHLLSRVEGAERGRVYDRLAALVPPPAGVTREGISSGDRVMRDLWWDELGLGSAELWRAWTTRAPGR